MAIIKVYRVVGTTGEYEDATSWDVMAYVDEGRATGMAERLNSWLVANGLHCDQPRRSAPSYGRKPAEDPRFQCDSTGTSYRIEAIDVDMMPDVKRRLC